MQVLTNVVFALISALKGAGLWALASAEQIGTVLISVLSSTGFWSVAAVAAAVGAAMLYLVKTNRLLLI